MLRVSTRGGPGHWAFAAGVATLTFGGARAFFWALGGPPPRSRGAGRGAGALRTARPATVPLRSPGGAERGADRSRGASRARGRAAAAAPGAGAGHPAVAPPPRPRRFYHPRRPPLPALAVLRARKRESGGEELQPLSPFLYRSLRSHLDGPADRTVEDGYGKELRAREGRETLHPVQPPTGATLGLTLSVGSFLRGGRGVLPGRRTDTRRGVEHAEVALLLPRQTKESGLRSETGGCGVRRQ